MRGWDAMESTNPQEEGPARAPGRRRTPQRVAVGEALRAEGAFVSAQHLHQAMRQAGSTIGLATVYRTLADLAADGTIDHMQQGGEALYRACETIGHHHHLICRRCGNTVEISAKPVEVWSRKVAAEHGYIDPEHVVDVFGVCPECAAR